MFECEKCHLKTARYDPVEHAMKCKECGYIEKIEPTQALCYKCGYPYIKYTWFDPCGCSKCGKSFVD
jgi:primosomal protein N'